MAVKPAPARKSSRGPGVALIHWHVAEGRELARLLTKAGFKVRLEADFRQAPAVLRRLRQRPPDVVIISLDRLPSHGRELGVAMRMAKATRHVPLMFVGGDASKVERVRQVLPDATYAGWTGLSTSLKKAIAGRPVSPMVPASGLAGYSGKPLPAKLGIKTDAAVALLNEPEGFVELLGALPEGVEFKSRLGSGTGLAIWFVRSMAELRAQVDSIAGALGRGRLWIAWPKRTSQFAGDLSEAAVRAAGLGAGLVDYKVAAIDQDWSGLLFAPRQRDKKKPAR